MRERYKNLINAGPGWRNETVMGHKVWATGEPLRNPGFSGVFFNKINEIACFDGRKRGIGLIK
ncbi:hypothetical protein NXC24_PC00888 (plasmid) [Rhizobium sp. NXC24]|nr:hypothetical protein NXC24_PC00888 [Rhizobium sp. NXC24]